jgi:hypothetical protein
MPEKKRVTKEILSELESHQTSTSRLEEIYQTHPTNAILRHLVKHPGCPPRLLAIHFTAFYREISENPALPLLFLENPAFLYDEETEKNRSYGSSTTHTQIIKKMLTQTDLNPIIVQSLTHHKSPVISQNAKLHCAYKGKIAPEDFLTFCPLLNKLECVGWQRELLQEIELMPSWLSSHIKIPKDALKKKRSNYTVNTPVFIKNFTKQEKEIILTICNSKTTLIALEENINQLLAHSLEMNGMLISIPSSLLFPLFLFHYDKVSRTHLQKTLTLWTTHSYEVPALVQFIVTLHTDNADWLKRRAASAHWDARLSVVLNPNVSAEILETLAQDGNIYVQCAASCRLEYPQEHDWQKRLFMQ